MSVHWVVSIKIQFRKKMRIKKFVTAVTAIAISLLGLSIPQVATAAPATGLSPSPTDLQFLPLTEDGSSNVTNVLIDFDPVGGSSTYDCVVSSGTLPTGMSLTQNTCVIEGETTTAGTYNFTLDVRDTANSNVDASVAYSVTVESYSLQNDNLRFGSGDNHSISPSGVLQQPWYYSSGLSSWQPLIYDDPNGYSVDLAFGVGTGGGDWHDNSEIYDLTDDLAESIDGDDLTITGWSVDKTGFVTVTNPSTGLYRGYGTLITETIFKTLGGDSFIVHNKFELGQNDNFVKATTSIENSTSAAWTSVNVWVGTRDDYVGNDDNPVNTKGNFVNGSFQAITNQTTPASVVMTTSASEGSFFYSTEEGANTVIDDCCSFNNIFDINPTTSPIEDDADDSAYGFVLNIGGLASGARSSNTVWYFGGGATASLGNISQAIAQAADPTPTQISIRDVPYYGPVNLQIDPRGLANGTANATGSNLDTVTTVSVNGSPTTFNLNPDGTITFDIPDLPAGRYQVTFFVQINNVNLVSTIEITGRATSAESEEKILNAGTFDRYVAVYAKGYAGSTLTWKIAGKWFKTELTENYQVFQRPTIYRNYAINVELYIDGEKLFQKNVLTK
jgi:hypothetical protein